MKKSHIDWCPLIPDHWEEKRIKDIAFLQSGSSITAMDIAEEGPYPVYGGNGMRGYTNRFTNEGDHVLIGRQGALCGNINYAHGKFYATEHAVVMYTHNDEITYWLGETLRAANLNRLSMTAAQPGLAVSTLNLQFIPYPPREERIRIANYLKSKLTDIDSQITLITSKRDAYLRLKKSIINHAVTQGLNPKVKMKDSGIEGIGEIPEHWEIKRMKDICTLSPTIKSCSQFKYGSFLPMEGLRLGQIETSDELVSTIQGKYTPFENNDLLIAKVTPCFENGNIAIAKGLTNGIGFGSSEIFVLRAKKILNIQFLFYMVLSSNFQNKACSTMCGVGGLKRISPLFMKSHTITIPSLIEQRTIATYLDEKCSKIDKLVANLEKQISLYTDMKRSLIDEVITGKRAV
jgi:type I restriction enzyme, S subunit